MHSGVKVLDPERSGAYITRNHAYLIDDTLFAIDAKFQPRPQMVDAWKVSDDKRVWTFTLRDGLEWHDGKPSTALLGQSDRLTYLSSLLDTGGRPFSE